MRMGHSRQEPNTSSRIAGTVCDGCPCLHVISSTGRRLKSERYWCSRRHARVDPHAGNIIANANTAISLLRFQSLEGMDVAGLVATTPKMLGGGR